MSHSTRPRNQPLDHLPTNRNAANKHELVRLARNSDVFDGEETQQQTKQDKDGRQAQQEVKEDAVAALMSGKVGDTYLSSKNDENPRLADPGLSPELSQDKLVSHSDRCSDDELNNPVSDDDGKLRPAVLMHKKRKHHPEQRSTRRHGPHSKPIGTLRNLTPLMTSVRESPQYPVMADSRGQDTAHRSVMKTRMKRTRRSNRERSGGTRTGLRRPAAASISPRADHGHPPTLAGDGQHHHHPPRASRSLSAAVKSAPLAEYQEWPFQGFPKRTRIRSETTYNLEFQLLHIPEHLHLSMLSEALGMCSDVRRGCNPSRHWRTFQDASVRPRIKRVRWTPKEDATILKMREVDSCSWEEIHADQFMSLYS
ncbi:uncharacterized protein LY89DRAFT_742965 [Mollisia scopiformis]|uniref:Myb-like domain-containing protein n=1 Tax=Mollisia scopiformis TaxID=149040 RepID=A0A132B4J8_MOLSC|nr:uncharacterized protein LY89DRAFT_742965 [Mollisia scopiformis]KUJ07330.1 hypothetical protein LY89DRAFT_742965 [Mollisia scopiformis]